MREIEDVLCVKDLYCYYQNGFFKPKKVEYVLRGITFDIRQGEIFGLVGESGCGKSTLGKAIAGIIPSKGDIIIEDKRVGLRRDKDCKKKIQFIFQDPLNSLNPMKKIGWILEEPLKIHKWGDKIERSHRIDEMLNLIGLDLSYRNCFPRELSGGQRQRVSIGCALMLNPRLIIADEPVSALDVSVQAQILNLMKDLHGKLNVSYLFISHNLNVIYYLCDRVAVMYKGQIVEMSDVERIYNKPLHPYTKMLLEACGKISYNDVDIRADGERLHAIKGICDFYSNCTEACEKCTKELPELVCINEEIKHYVRCHKAKKGWLYE